MTFRSVKSVLSTVLGREKTPQTFSGIGTVLQSDISFAEISNGMGAETLVTEMNTAFGVAGRHIAEAGGFVVSSMGDAVLAVWSPSFMAPPHAELALTCGVKILEELGQSQRNSKCPCSIRIVLATGKMAVTIIGGRFQVYGPPMAVAKRLETFRISKRNQILCTSETLAYVPGGTRQQPVGQVKGVSGHDVDVFEFSCPIINIPRPA